MPSLNTTAQRALDFTKPLQYNLASGKTKKATFVGVLNTDAKFKQRFNNVFKVVHSDSSKDYIRFSDDFGNVTSLNSYDEVPPNVAGLVNVPENVTKTIYTYRIVGTDEFETSTIEQDDDDLVLVSSQTVTYTV